MQAICGSRDPAQIDALPDASGLARLPPPIYPGTTGPPGTGIHLHLRRGESR